MPDSRGKRHPLPTILAQAVAALLSEVRTLARARRTSRSSPRHEHGTRRLTQHLVAYAAEYQACDAAAITASDNDEIVAAILGNLADEGGRAPYRLAGIAGNTQLLADLARPNQGCQSLLPQGRLTPVHRFAVFRRQGDRVQHPEECLMARRGTTTDENVSAGRLR